MIKPFRGWRGISPPAGNPEIPRRKMAGNHREFEDPQPENREAGCRSSSHRAFAGKVPTAVSIDFKPSPR